MNFGNEIIHNENPARGHFVQQDAGINHQVGVDSYVGTTAEQRVQTGNISAGDLLTDPGIVVAAVLVAVGALAAISINRQHKAKHR